MNQQNYQKNAKTKTNAIFVNIHIEKIVELTVL